MQQSEQPKPSSLPSPLYFAIVSRATTDSAGPRCDRFGRYEQFLYWLAVEGLTFEQIGEAELVYLEIARV